MSFWRSWSVKALTHLALPVPQRERVAHVYVKPKGAIPSVGVQCLCRLAAIRHFRVAHEHRCTQIVIHDGAHTHPFDTMQLLRSHVRDLGWWPSPLRVAGKTPGLLATRGFQRLGDEVTEHPTTMVPVPIQLAVSDAPGAPALRESAAKETPHGQ